LALLGLTILARFGPLGMQETSVWAEWRCLFGFFTGVLTYEVWRFGWLRRLRGTSAEAVTVIAVIAFIVFWGTDKTLVYLAPLIFALAVLVFAAEGGAISRLLTTRLGGALGRWSYSIYMVHTLILALLFSGLSVLGVVAHHKWVVPHGPGGSLIIDLGGQVADNLAILAYLGVVVALAAFAWRFVERPGQLYFNRLAVAQKLEIYTQTV
jgi:peptidoglycan/LPS O-acetylase OafA/YrhL